MLNILRKAITDFFKASRNSRLQLERAVRKSEEEKNLIMNAALDAIVFMDTKGRITFWNPQAEKIFKWKKDEVTGRLLSDIIIPEQHREQYVKDFQDCFKVGEGAVLNKLLECSAIDKLYNGLQIELSILPIKQEDNSFFCAFIRDITERKKAEKAISDSEEKYRMLFDNTPLPQWIYDLETLRILEVNEAAQQHYGYSRDEFLGMTIKDIRPEKEVKRLEGSVQRTWKTEGVADFGEWEHKKKDGGIIQVNIFGHKINYNGRPAVMILSHDITKAKIAEQKLANERNILRAIIDNIPDYVYVKDTESRHIVNNKALVKSMRAGHEEETLGKTVFDFLPFETARSYIQDDRQVIETGNAIYNKEETIIGSDGELYGFITTKVPLKDKNENIIGVVGITRDVSFFYRRGLEQKLIYDIITALGKNETLIQGLSETLRIISSHLGFKLAEAWLLDIDRKKLSLRASWMADGTAEDSVDSSNLSFEQGEGIPGITWKTAKIGLWKDISQDEKLPGAERAAKAGLKSAIGLPILFKDEVIAVLVFFNQNSLQHAESFFTLMTQVALQIGLDIQRKKTEDELNSFFNFSPDLLCIAGPDGYFKKINPAFTSILGYTESELLSRPYADLIHPDDQNITVTELQGIVKGRAASLFQNRYRTRSGEWKWISWSSSSFIEESGLFFAYGKDITESKNAELQLLQFKNVIENSQNAIGIISLPDYRIYMNRSFSEMLGYSHQELISMERPLDLYGDTEVALNAFYSLLEGQYWKGDIQLKNNKGELLDFYLNAGPVFNKKQELIAIYGIHTDIRERKQHEKKLKDYGQRISNILESITDGFYTLDRNWIVRYWNREAERLLKISKEEIIGKNLWDVFKEFLDLKLYSSYHNVMNNRETVLVEEYFPSLNRWFEVNAYPSEDGISVYFKDVTEKRQAIEEIRIAKERYDMVVRATKDAIWDWDVVNQHMEWGEGFSNLFGYDLKKELATFTSWASHIHPEDEQRVVNSLIDCVNSGSANQWEEEYRYIMADGSVVTILDRGFVIRDEQGKPLRMIGAMQDITAQKHSEGVLKQLNDQLNKRAQELAASNAELEQFAYIASHDLQEPLRMVTSFLTQLEKKYKNQLDETASKYIWFAVDGAVRMRRIILDLLEYSRVGRATGSFEKVDMNELLDEVLKLNSNLIKETNAKVTRENLPEIVAARAPIQHVFYNLISNAIKYQKPGMDPVISIKAQETSNYWQFSVTDNGIGIDPKFFNKIFIIFQRLHNKDEYSGTGIGLAICKKIIEGHKGKIWVESVPEQGSTFYFTISKQI